MDDLLYNITGRNLEKLMLYLEANSLFYKKNTAILSNSLQENVICLLIDGKVQISKDDFNGNHVIIDVFEKNDIFGTVISGITNNDYEVKTLEDSKIVIIDFNNIMSNNTNTIYTHQFLKNLLNVMSNKLQENNERIEILSSKTIRNKLLAYFKNLAKKSNTRVIYLPFSLTRLAEYLSIDRCAMSRELKNLKEEGFIEIQDGRVKLKINE